MTSVSSNAGPSFDYLYHRNLQLQKAIYSNGVVGVYGKGDANLVRPKRRTFKNGLRTFFDTGTYAYDGAGNIQSLTTDNFTSHHRL